ncbi:MAG: phosphoadenylyl-sulfate reductase [Candidatus Thiodiazotropha weberae]|uniref:Phosphoadenosine 5'-phosphosulfate reductase n=1 Tax=Candidatus Thiodiazotropha endoloripes TaxID=1818881 RepID=A0A1E2UTH9_9GAMM|nr:phosphoadenylyl-sulfate reductase [Candidatus Thiodiazotropha endoloripes]MCG7898498.1 phosphoadenylyl-sulfate reductase [Candidatus Thiodiazotropha weberae]ODB97754.1 phosphoadenosine phosphosulfate reductase [Candidatus Thiodiazotropha endoloripes]
MTHLDSITAPEMVDEKYLQNLNHQLEKRTAEDRLEWALNYLPGSHVLTSSFGIQSALMLHMVTEIQADISVVLVDTGYLFPETYSFIDQLTEQLKLNLQIYRPLHSPTWQERRYGRLWEKGLSGIEHYNRINKVEPLQRALNHLDVGSWFAGLRRQQSTSRSSLPVVRIQDGRFKVHPIIDWHNRDVHRYLRKYDLPYHPLWEQGYASVGDTHTSQPMKLGMQEEETRFFGLKRECGIHE